MTVIGIDFGTSRSSVAVLVGRQVELLTTSNTSSISPNYGNTCIATTVQFTPCERLIGVECTRPDVDPENRVFHIKRLLGRSSTILQDLQSLSLWPFQMDKTDNRVMINVQYRHLNRKYVPEQLAAMILERLRLMAEERLGNQTVSEVVLSCPASFNPCQRQALINAARIARMNVVQLITETTAAAIAYRVQVGCDKPQNLLMFDMGGGSTNVSVISVHGEMFDVIASSGNNALGGEDFTHRMMYYFVQEFFKLHAQDVTKNKTAMERLRAACDKAKCTLSVQTTAHISLPDFHNGINYSARITRSCFEELCKSFFNRIRRLVGFVIHDSRVKAEQIDQIVLVGGSSRIPRVQSILSEYFPQRTLDRQLSPEEAIIYGTGLFTQTVLEEGKALNGLGSNFSPCVNDVIAHSLGVEVNDDTFSPIIQRFSILPVKARKTYTTAFNNQTSVRFNILAGDYLLAKYDDSIGTIIVSDIPLAHEKTVKISLSFQVDRNGLLTIESTATQPDHKTVCLRVEHDSVSLTESEIAKMIEEAKTLLSEDQENKNLALVKKSLLDYVEEKRKQLSRVYASGQLTDSDNAMLAKKYDHVTRWVTDNPACTKYRYKQKQAELDVLWTDIVDGHTHEI